MLAVKMMFVQLLGVEEHFLGETILPDVTPSPLATCSCFSERNVLIENATNAVISSDIILTAASRGSPCDSTVLVCIPNAPNANVETNTYKG